MAQTEQIEALNKYITEATKALEIAKNSLSDNNLDALVNLAAVLDTLCKFPDKIGQAEQNKFDEITGKLKALKNDIDNFMTTNREKISELLKKFDVRAALCIDDGTPAGKAVQNLGLYHRMAPITVGGGIGA